MDTFEVSKKEIKQFLESQDYVRYIDANSILDALLQRALELESNLSKELMAVDTLIDKLKSSFNGELDI